MPGDNLFLPGSKVGELHSIGSVLKEGLFVFFGGNEEITDINVCFVFRFVRKQFIKCFYVFDVSLFCKNFFYPLPLEQCIRRRTTANGFGVVGQ